VNAALVVTLGLLFALGAAHSYLGERYLLMRLFRRPDLPKLMGSDVFTKRTLRFAWHLTTVAWWGIGAMLLVSARAGRSVPTGDVGAVVAVTSAVSGVVALLWTRGRHLSWVVFLIIAVTAWLGTR